MNSLVPSKRRYRAYRKGFSLVELMVVISIILILAFLSFVGITRARSAARAAVCTSNLRQIGSAMIAYTIDNNGQLPPLEDRTGSNNGLRGIWPELLAETNVNGVPNPAPKGGYIPRVLRNNTLTCAAGVWACPECKVLQTNYQGFGVAEGTVMKVMNTSSGGNISSRIAQIPNPERTWLVGDAVKTPTNLESGWYAIWANPASWGGQSPGARHNGKVNVCMVDGHIESLTLIELRAKDYTMFR